MNFQTFKNCLFYKNSTIRINPLTLEKWVSEHVLDCTNISDVTDFDDFNVYLDEISKLPIYLNFEQAIRAKLPNTTDKSIVWIPEEFRIELLRQKQEVQSLIQKIKDLNPDNKILRHRVLMSCPGDFVSSHHHYFTGSTVTICFKFDDNQIPYSSLLEMGYKKKPVYLPKLDNFYFHLKNNPLHGAKVNHWIFWWYTDFINVLQNVDLPLFELKSPLFVGDNLITPPTPLQSL